MSEMKKRLQRKGARKGFTLVELLIVIIIIGILAGAMMLVAGTSRDSAEASKIISDLRTMKAAALMLISDNPEFDKADWEALDTGQDKLDQLNNYLDRPIIYTHTDDSPFPYIFATIDLNNTATEEPTNDKVTLWLLGLDVSGRREGVKGNLKKQAESVGLFAGDGDGIDADAWPLGSDDYYNMDTHVYVIVQ